jgi:pimeloyl-ACP methyl ester carboxylesterase
MTTPAIQYVTANGVRFAYLEEGQGPLVLLVHGFPDTPQTWDAARPALARAGFRAVTPWTRGYAPTAIPADGAYDSETLGKDVLALIEALGESSAIVVGHDWGASAAFVAAGLEPSRVRMLITIAIPHPASLRPSLGLAWKIRHMLALRGKRAAEKMLARDLVYVDTLVKRWSPAWQVPAGETDAVKRVFREPGSLDAALGYYRAFSPRLPAVVRAKVTVPAAAFAGETDIVPPSAYERARSRYAGPYEVITLGGGHFMHREEPERFVTELVRVVGAAR